MAFNLKFVQLRKLIQCKVRLFQIWIFFIVWFLANLCFGSFFVCQFWLFWRGTVTGRKESSWNMVLGIPHLIVIQWFTKSSVLEFISISKKLFLALLVLNFDIFLSFYRHWVLDWSFNALSVNYVYRQDIFWSHTVGNFLISLLV